MTGSPDSANDGTSQRGSLFRQQLDSIVKGFLLAHGERVPPVLISFVYSTTHPRASITNGLY